jgi:ergothioneine biosynthesis protein EgtB
MSSSVINLTDFLPLYRQCRQKTGEMWQQLVAGGEDRLFQQLHPDYSPMAWHFGHIAFTEMLWILQHLGGLRCFSERQFHQFAADGLPKAERGQVMTVGALGQFLWEGHSKVIPMLQSLDAHEWRSQERLWLWLFHHECQHQETIAFLWQHAQPRAVTPPPRGSADGGERWIPPGAFMQGTLATHGSLGLDNERQAFPAAVTSGFWIVSEAVRRSPYGEFMAVGGYNDPQWWSDAGWQWRCDQGIDRPQYWDVFTDPRDPVVGVSWYEASAYAHFRGMSLPSETEWEWACLWVPELIGTVWQWTRSPFAPYPGFVPFPYAAYSQDYFDGGHYVLRGGSWVTHPKLQRKSFRNWYHPHVRQPFTGICCVRYDHGL